MEISYQVIRSARKTISIRITPEGKVEVRCPWRVSGAEVQRFVDSKRRWIEKHMAGKEKLQPFEPGQLEQLAIRAKEVIPARVAYYAPLVGVTYGHITIRAQRSRWGSCSSKGNLNFNCLLMLVPEEVLDYVVVHELCHRRELNHSARFWAEVEKILPDYRQRQKWLKDRGGAIIGRLSAGGDC